MYRNLNNNILGGVLSGNEFLRWNNSRIKKRFFWENYNYLYRRKWFRISRMKF